MFPAFPFLFFFVGLFYFSLFFLLSFAFINSAFSCSLVTMVFPSLALFFFSEWE